MVDVDHALERPRSLTATVADRLRQAIIDAELPLGGELSEVGLAAKLGVSRTPVREALALLQLQGMVTILPQKESHVFLPTEEDVVELCEYRIVLESRATAFAVARHDPGHARRGARRHGRRPRIAPDWQV